MTEQIAMELAIEEKRLQLINKKNDVRKLEQELRILELKAGRQPTAAAQVPAQQLVPEEKSKSPESQILARRYLGPVQKRRRDLSADEANSLPKQPIHKSMSPSPSSLIALQSRLIKTTVNKKEWINLYKKLTQSTFEDKIIPVLRNSHVKAVAMEDLNTKILIDYFNSGLLDTIYPSSDLKELIGLPKIRQSISFFMERLKVRQQNKNVFINVRSTVPDWEDGKGYQAYHLIKIGIVGTFQPPTIVEKTGELLDEDISIKRLDGFYFIYKELEEIDTNSFIRLNYATDNVMILSKNKKPVSPQDLVKINKWKEDIFNQPRVAQATKERLKDVVKFVTGKQ